jgi:Arc/MetJ-type ribon-helix-helix transcriptional regulator
MVRVTFSLSDETVAEIRRTAARLRKPQSHVIRDAVADYAARSDRLSEPERRQALATLERLRATKSNRSAAEVDEELRSIRAARRAGGRRLRSGCSFISIRRHSSTR